MISFDQIRVEHELADVLRTAAGDRDLCGPLQGGSPGWYIDDRHAADELLALRERAVDDHPVGLHVVAEIRSAALSIASLQLAQYAGKTRRLSIVMMVLLLISSVVGAVTDSLWVLVPALFFGVMLFWQWYLPRQIRRRIKLLSEATTASAD